MIYRRFAACLMAICLMTGVITPLSQADQAVEGQMVSEIQTDTDKTADSDEIKESVVKEADKQSVSDVSEDKTVDSAAEKPAEVNAEAVQVSEPALKTVEENDSPEKTEAELTASGTDENKNSDAPEEKPSTETGKETEAPASPETTHAPETTPEPEATAEPEITPSPETTEPVDVPCVEATVAPECTPEAAEIPENSTAPELPDEAGVEQEENERPDSGNKPDEDAIPEQTKEPEKNDPEDIEQADTEDGSDISETADALKLKAAPNCRYAFARSDTVKIHTSVSGGIAPYEVVFTAKGAASEKKTVTLDGEDACTFKCAPEEFGELKITVKVTDAEGSTATEKIEIPVPVRVREDAEDWEKDFEDMVLTGDWRIDLIAVALTQLGYVESSRNFIVEEDGKRLGYTRYGDWYSDSSDYYDWCAMFVCFCMHYADIPRADYPRDNISHRWMEYLEKTGAFEAAENYEPAGGDLIFFNKDDDSRMDHIGIVEFADDECVHTIEGNSGKKVERKSYKLDDETIAGYGNTAYLMEKAGVETEEDESDSVKKVRKRYEGYTAGTMVNIRAEASADSAWVACIPEKDTKVTVRGIEFTEDKMWYRIAYEDYEGYILGDLLKVDGYMELVYAAADRKE